MEDVRKAQLEQWGREQLVKAGQALPADARLVPVSDDASFRRYFRFDSGAPGRVFVDAPPTHEDNPSYVLIAKALGDHALSCPEVIAVDYDLGFLVVSDLGNARYLSVITAEPDRRDELYHDALVAMADMQATDCELPRYDATRLLDEMNLFQEWLLPGLLELEIRQEDAAMLEQVKSQMIESAVAQPQVFVHRDYHSRNLMVLEAGNPGILDFQDAVIGPLTYDLVSLYKDCYYRFEREEVEHAVAAYLAMVQSKGLAQGVIDAEFLRWFDLMGIQRHLKCAGIFARLYLRDGKPGYLGDIPLVVDYLIEAARLYPECQDLAGFLETEIRPRVARFSR